MVTTVACCSICRFETDRERRQFRAVMLEGRAYISHSFFRCDNSTKFATDDGKHHF